MNDKHTLLCIMGRTSSGKDTLARALRDRLGAKVVISNTTRQRRVNEGETHYFVTKEDYKGAKDAGNIAAFTEIEGNYYWTTVDQVMENDVYVIDPKGVKTLEDLKLPNLRLVRVYVNVPDDIREERAIHSRGDDKHKFRSRNLAERRQFENMLKNGQFDYAIPNINFPEAYAVLKWIYTVEGGQRNMGGDQS